MPDRVIVSDKLLQPASQRVTTARAGRAPTAEHPDAGRPVSSPTPTWPAYFSNAESPVLSAHHLLADLATIYFDSPGRTRSIVVLPPARGAPNAALLGPVPRRASSRVRSSRRHRWTGCSSPRRRRRSRAPASCSRRLLRLRRPSAFASLRRTITSLQIVLADSPDSRAELHRPATHRRVVGALPRTERRAYVDGLARAVNDERHKFQLPKGGSLTLTARRGGIPITVRSTTGYPAHVLLQVASDRLKFPGGSTKSLTLARHDTTHALHRAVAGFGRDPVAHPVEVARRPRRARADSV